MIIECNSCTKKFNVDDVDIPPNGRLVQCGNCSTQWLQLPISIIDDETIDKPDIDDESIDKPDLSENLTPTKSDLNENLANNEQLGPDGKNYRYMGMQWVEILPSGKSGRLAKRKIQLELNQLAGINKPKQRKKNISKKYPDEVDKYTELGPKKGMGILSFLIVLIIFAAAVLLVLDTFKSQLIQYWPALDDYLVYVFETLNNIYILIIDLFNNYYK